MTSKINLVIADDHQLFIDGLTSILAKKSFVNIIATVNNGADLMAVLKSEKVDLVLLDLDMPLMDGVEVLKKVSVLTHIPKIIVVTMHAEPAFIMPVLKLNAAGYLLKDTSEEELIEAIKHVVNGKIYISKAVKEIVNQFNQNNTVNLSPRELEVLKSLTQGLTSVQIAEKLFISKHTVESHRKSLLSKLKMNNTAELIQLANKNGLV